MAERDSAVKRLPKAFQFVKKTLKAASEIGRGGVYVAPAAIFLSENPIFQKKNRFLADFTAGIRRIQVKSGRGGRGGGACSPVHQTVKGVYFPSIHLTPPPKSGMLNTGSILHDLKRGHIS